MKRVKFKNNIAFTMMEMTLVLLITSIIAAVSTPIITSSVSDFAGKTYGGASSAEAVDVPWRRATGYNGGGIYNSPEKTYSAVGINTKFGASASNYGYPSLAIENSSGNNLFNAPQIQILNSSGVYSNIAMDEFENLSIVTGNNSYQASKIANNGTNSTYIGSGNVLIGKNIQSLSSLTAEEMYYQNSVLIGMFSNTRMSVNAITIGFANNRLSHERNTVTIGQFLDSIRKDATYEGTVEIGYYASKYMATNSIRLGSYASNYSSNLRDIAVGYYAGFNYDKNQANGSATPSTQDNVLIGSYAGSTVNSTMFTEKNKLSNVAIGLYANSYHFNRGNSRNIAIGTYAGSDYGDDAWGEFFSRDIWSADNVSIGRYAGLKDDSSVTMSRNINIGHYAGMTGKNISNDVINIGSYAGNDISANHDKAIIIGGSETSTWSTGKGFSTNNANNIIALGTGAGYNGAGSYAISLGSYAGVGMGSPFSSSYASSGSNYGSVSIGYKAGINHNQANIWYIGWGNLQDNPIYLSSGTGTLFNTPSTISATPRMFIGYGDNAMSSHDTTIVLYANDVYRPGSTQFDVLRYSDQRLKTNIVPVQNSLDKIRKVNIYDYTLKDDMRHTPRIGVIAQEFKNIFPHDVKLEQISNKYVVRTDWLIYSMVEAIKELDANVQNVQAKFDAYVKDYMGLKSRVARLEKQTAVAKAQNEQIKTHLAKINAKLK